MPRNAIWLSREHPATCQAMFVMPTGLRFARHDTEPELRATFAALSASIPAHVADNAAATGLVWAALHELAELDRTGWIRTTVRKAHIALIKHGFSCPEAPAC